MSDFSYTDGHLVRWIGAGLVTSLARTKVAVQSECVYYARKISGTPHRKCLERQKNRQFVSRVRPSVAALNGMKRFPLEMDEGALKHLL